MDAHLSAHEIAAVVDGGITPERRPAVDAHLAICAECRAEVAAVSQIVDSAPSLAPSLSPSRARPRRAWLVAVGAIAAAIVAMVVIPNVRRSTPTAANDVRAGDGSAGVVTIAPATTDRPVVGALRFAWHAVAGVSTYKLVVTDSVGTPVLELSTPDTAVGPLAIAGTKPNDRYIWYVDALRVDGTSISGPPTSFIPRVR